MIEVTHLADTNIVELTIDGEITAQELDGAMAKLNHVIAQEGKIRMLKEVRAIAFPPIPLATVWDDLKFSFGHLGDITHAAIVADQKWIESMVRLLQTVLKIEIKHFKLSELEQAREWLRTAPTPDIDQRRLVSK